MIRKRYYHDKQEYWTEVETTRTEHSPHLIEWAFDFISIHKNRDNYSLLSPLFLCDIKRPRFEQRKFSTFYDALAYAIKLADAISRKFKTCHIVSCCEESRLYNRFIYGIPRKIGD